MKEQTSVISGRQTMPDWAFVLWAGGTALLSYSLVYALRKPFTAAEFAGMQVCGMDYKIAVSIVQLLGYVSAKLLGIKFISELRPEGGCGSSSVRSHCLSSRSSFSVCCPHLII